VGKERLMYASTEIQTHGVLVASLFAVGVAELKGVLKVILVSVITEGPTTGLKLVVGNRWMVVGVVEVGTVIPELEAMVATTVDGARTEEDGAGDITLEDGRVGALVGGAGAGGEAGAGGGKVWVGTVCVGCGVFLRT
jgi:hypothetical protein